MTRKTALATAVRIVPLGFGLALLTCVATRLGVHGILRMLVDMMESRPVLLLYAGHEVRATALMGAFEAETAQLRRGILDSVVREAVECLTFTGPMLSGHSVAAAAG
jgi:hypothetical protein